jgi:hypothetical protein
MNMLNSIGLRTPPWGTLVSISKISDVMFEIII